MQEPKPVPDEEGSIEINKKIWNDELIEEEINTAFRALDMDWCESIRGLVMQIRDDLQATIATLTALPKELSDSIIRRDATIATQAARIEELEKQVTWKEGLIRQLTDVDMPAMQADNERLRAELAAAQAELVAAKREIELINEANAPMRPRAFWDDKLTERRCR